MNVVKSAVLAAVLALSALIAGCGGSSDDTPEAAAVLFMQSFYAGDGAKVMEQILLPSDITDKQRKAAGSKIGAMAAAAKQGAEQHGGLDKVEAIKTEVKGEGKDAAAQVELKLTFKDGTTDTEKVHTAKDADGKWKVNLK